MLGRLNAAGCDIVSDPESADVMIVNTCGFITDAKRESIKTILEMARLKNGKKQLIVTGCLVQRYVDELRRELPEVDAWVGVFGQEAIPEIIGVKSPQPSGKEPFRALTGPPHLAYLKIAEGCSRKCSFCAIPGIRGLQQSRPIDELVEEAAELASHGATELILIAQDTTNYGKDLPGTPDLISLIQRLAALREVRWIRIMYLYPTRVTRKLLEMIAGESKVCKYLDIPLQHCQGDVLAAMRRGGDRMSTTKLIDKIRSVVPGIFLRSSFMVGFPTETQRRFKELVSFLRDASIDHVGVFTYSREEGTEAWGLGDPVSQQEKRHRRSILMRVQNEISANINRARIGEHHEAVVEGIGSNYYLCRISGQAPEIDGITRMRMSPDSDSRRLDPGDYVNVRITGASAYDLRGVRQ